MRRILLSAAICVACLHTGGHEAAAAPILFDFESAPYGGDSPLAITTGGLTANFASPGNDPGAFAITSSFGFRTLSGNILLSPGSAFVSNVPLVISFSRPVTSVSLLFGLDGGTGATLSLAVPSGGSAQGIGTRGANALFAEGTLTYTGASFSSVTLTASTLDFGIDNLSVTPADATVVPEPLAAVSMLMGLAGLGVARARRRARH